MISFASSGQVVSEDNASIKGPFAGGGTISLWLRLDVDGTGTVWWINPGADADGVFEVGVATTRRVQFTINWTTTSGIWQGPDTALVVGTLHHVLIAYDSDSTANDPVMYVDGVSVTVTETQAPTGTLLDDAGADAHEWPPTASAFSGDYTIGHCQMWSSALTAADALAIYHGRGVHRVWETLTHWWSMAELSPGESTVDTSLFVRDVTNGAHATGPTTETYAEDLATGRPKIASGDEEIEVLLVFDEPGVYLLQIPESYNQAEIKTWGAPGGSTPSEGGWTATGGNGAHAAGTLGDVAGKWLRVDVGQQGQVTPSASGVYSAGGGGLTAVSVAEALLLPFSAVLIAGAGGGSSAYSTAPTVGATDGGHGGDESAAVDGSDAFLTVLAEGGKAATAAGPGAGGTTSGGNDGFPGTRFNGGKGGDGDITGTITLGGALNGGDSGDGNTTSTNSGGGGGGGAGSYGGGGGASQPTVESFPGSGAGGGTSHVDANLTDSISEAGSATGPGGESDPDRPVLAGEAPATPATPAAGDGAVVIRLTHESAPSPWPWPFPTTDLFSRLSPADATLDADAFQRVSAWPGHAEQSYTDDGTLAGELPDTCRLLRGRTCLWMRRDPHTRIYHTGADWDWLMDWANDFEIRYHIHPLDTAGDSWLLHDNGTAGGISFGILAGGAVEWTIDNSTGAEAYSVTTATGFVEAGDGVLVVRKSGMDVTIEWNEKEHSETISPTGSVGTNNATIYRFSKNNLTDSMHGYVGECCIWMRALTSDERIGANMEMGHSLAWTEGALIADRGETLPLRDALLPGGIEESGGNITEWRSEFRRTNATIVGTVPYESSTSLGIPGIGELSASNYLTIDAYADDVDDTNVPFVWIVVVAADTGTADYFFSLGNSAGVNDQATLFSNSNVSMFIRDGSGATAIAESVADPVSRYVVGLCIQPDTTGGETTTAVLALDSGVISEGIDTFAATDFDLASIGVRRIGPSTVDTPQTGDTCKVLLGSGPISRGELVAIERAVGIAAGI